jgi:hypothetical protein
VESDYLSWLERAKVPNCKSRNFPSATLLWRTMTVESAGGSGLNISLKAPLSYTISRGNIKKIFDSLLLHLSHHRSQACTLVLQPGIDISVTDLNKWIPDH